MSYDISIVDQTGNVCKSKIKHDVRGGTYAVEGTTELWLSVTFNYATIFNELFGDGGIKNFNGVSIKDSIPKLLEAAGKLESDDPIVNDYWKPTSGNVKKTLLCMVQLTTYAPEDALWEVKT